MCEWGDVVRVERPNDGRTVPIDRCALPVLQELWRAGITTYAVCCGHNKPDTPNPTVIVDSDPDMLALADDILPSRWVIYRSGTPPLDTHQRRHLHQAHGASHSTPNPTTATDIRDA